MHLSRLLSIDDANVELVNNGLRWSKGVNPTLIHLLCRETLKTLNLQQFPRHAIIVSREDEAGLGRGCLSSTLNLSTE